MWTKCNSPTVKYGEKKNVLYLSSEGGKTGGGPTEKLGDEPDAEPTEPTSNVNGSSIRPLLAVSVEIGLAFSPAPPSASKINTRSTVILFFFDAT